MIGRGIRRGTLLAAIAALATSHPAAAALPHAPCTGDPSKVHQIGLTVNGQPTYGLYTLPRHKPRGLAVFGHGYSYNVDAWRAHLIRAATHDGLVAVAMNYRGLKNLPADSTGFPRSRGWPVKAGSEDLVAAGQALQQRCGGFARRFLLGVSMGGNSTGMAAALDAKTADGRPLFDYWIGIEGVYNLTELYNQATLVAPTNTFAAQAKQDIEAETGGTPLTAPDAYAQRTVVNRAADIARSGLRGVVLVHAIDDGEASYDQAQQMERALRANGVATDLYSVGRKAPGDTPDTTLDGNQANAGHAPEWSTHHIVLDTGFDRLSHLAAGDQPPPCNRDFAVDGASHTVTPDPASAPAGCATAPTFAGSACHDTKRPVVSLRVRHGRKRGTLVIRGKARDRGCAGLARVRIAVAQRVRGHRCRFVRATGGRRGHARSCARPQTLRPHGLRTFRMTIRHLPAGRYGVTAIASDRAKHRARKTRRIRLT